MFLPYIFIFLLLHFGTPQLHDRGFKFPCHVEGLLNLDANRGLPWVYRSNWFIRHTC